MHLRSRFFSCGFQKLLLLLAPCDSAAIHYDDPAVVVVVYCFAGHRKLTGESRKHSHPHAKVPENLLFSFHCSRCGMRAQL